MDTVMPSSQSAEAGINPIPRIFVSHSSKDMEFARRLVDDLKHAGAEVWWNVSTRDPGDFIKRINDALRACDWLIVLLTPDALASEYVKWEVNAALLRVRQKLMRAVIPLLVKPCPIESIPPLLAFLEHYDSTVDYDVSLQELLRVLGLKSGLS